MRPGSVLQVLGAAALALLLVLAFTPLAPALARRMATPPRLEPADAIVVLGADVAPDGTLSGPSLRRAIHGIRLHRRGLAPWLVFTGMPERRRRPQEAAVRAALARELGVPATAILALSTWTTREEAERSRDALVPRRARRIILVTDSQHMLRAAGVFQRAGFEVLPAPADAFPHDSTPENRLYLARDVVEELLARGLYRLSGSL
jgi:uncharacterized SAM-binding protein YcdF (DUF218 family)